VQPRLSRLLTLVAAAVLAFDGAALAAFGWWSGRVLLMLVGGMCFVSAGLVLLSWRWHRQRLEDIAQLRRGLAQETRELRRFLGGE
jgi:hypothetical protein